MSYLLQKFLFTLEPETAHELVKHLTPLVPDFLLKKMTALRHPCLSAQIGKTELLNPIGLAAGFDKNAEMTGLVEALGFGFAEIGSVTAKACAGNPKPRIFRLPEDESLINWMGLPNQGAEMIARRLERLKSDFPLFINIAKTPDFSDTKKSSQAYNIEDYLSSYRLLERHGRAIVLNLSCPNTADGTSFEDPKVFATLAREIAAARRENKNDRPHLIKISPDLDPEKLPKIVEMAMKHGFDGFVVSNTTRERYNLKSKLPAELLQHGGLSGAGLSYLANQKLAHVFSITGKNALLIAVGGIMNFEDLLLKFSLGASLVQIYTGLIFKGPFFVRDLKRQLKNHCGKLGIKSYRDLIGLPMREIKSSVEVC